MDSYKSLVAMADRSRQKGGPQPPNSVFTARFLLHNDLRRHFRMDRTEIVVGAGLREGEAELLVCIQGARFERGLVIAYHSVRDIIVIYPCHLGAGWDSDRGWREAEIVDGDLLRSGIVRCQGLSREIGHHETTDDDRQRRD